MTPRIPRKNRNRLKEGYYWLITDMNVDEVVEIMFFNKRRKVLSTYWGEMWLTEVEGDFVGPLKPPPTKKKGKAK